VTFRLSSRRYELLQTHTRGIAIAAILSAVAAPSARGQRPVEVAPNAPQDRPVMATMRCQLEPLRRAIAPLSAAGRASFPAARGRFEKGLPKGQPSFGSTWLHDSSGHEELVFVALDSVTGAKDAARIAGRIWSPVQSVRGYRYRQPYTFPVTDLVDWMIAKPDGSEEGNEVGKFMDTYVPPATCADSGRSS
jgi:hypothetical protein